MRKYAEMARRGDTRAIVQVTESVRKILQKKHEQQIYNDIYITRIPPRYRLIRIR